MHLRVSPHKEAKFHATHTEIGNSFKRVTSTFFIILIFVFHGRQTITWVWNGLSVNERDLHVLAMHFMETVA